MTINVQQEQIDIKKELVRSQSNGHQLMDQHDLVNMPNLSCPQLLTVLMGGGGINNRRYGTTSAFQYDEKDFTPVAVTSKRYDERGNDVPKDLPKTRFYEIPSKGVRVNAAPTDYDGRRKPGTNELLTEADVLADLAQKVMKGFDIETELEYGQILTLGTNRVTIGTSYDFSLDITGDSRAAAATINFASVDYDPAIKVRGYVNEIKARASAYGLSVERCIVIAGDDFFDAAYEHEKLVTIARELRSNIDLASQALPQLRASSYLYDNFSSPTTGVQYIRYGASFFGTQVVDHAEAFVIPILMDAPLVVDAFAPAKVQGIVNTQAREMYSWFYSNPFEGVVGMYESNRITILPRPDLIIALTID